MKRDFYQPDWVDETPPNASEEDKQKIRLMKENLWMAYWEAGCPFGSSPEGMHYWIAFDTQTTAN